MTNKDQRPVELHYSADLQTEWIKAKERFFKRNRVTLTGITSKIEGRQLIISIEKEQHEIYLFEIALCFGIEIELSNKQ